MIGDSGRLNDARRLFQTITNPVKTISAPKSVKYRSLAKRRFGVELEINNSVDKLHVADVISEYSDRKIRVSNWAQSVANDYWHIKSDATCGIIGRGYDKGWEIASFVGRGEDDIQHIGMIAQALSFAGCEVNENCGLHVHVEVSDFDAYQMGILLGHYAKWEDALLDFVPKHRHKNPFCVNLSELFDVYDRRDYWSPAEMWLWLKPECHSPHNNPYRWRSVNLVNFSLGILNPKWERKTIEFRIPECSLVDYDVRNWIRLFVNFVEWAKHQAMPEDIESCLPLGFDLQALDHMGLGHDSDTFCIFDKELFNAKTWLLRRYIRFRTLTTSDMSLLPKQMLNEMWNPERNFA